MPRVSRLKNPKTSLVGYTASAAGVLALLADLLPGKYGLYLLVAG